METGGRSEVLYEFADFCLNTNKRVLLRAGDPVPLTPKAFDTLLMLVRNSGHVVVKNQLLSAVWPDAFVEEATLAQNIFTLRKALAQGHNGEQFIETVPKYGYRFVSGVREVVNESTEIRVNAGARTHVVTREYEEAITTPGASVAITHQDMIFDKSNGQEREESAPSSGSQTQAAALAGTPASMESRRARS